MATKDDNDDDWQDEEHKIATTPESVTDLMQPIRDIGGVVRDGPFQDGREPDPHVYRSVFDPERYRWRHPRHKYEVHPAYAAPQSNTSGGGAH